MTLPYEAAAPPSPLARARSPAGTRLALLEAAALLAAVAVFLLSVLPNLANHPTLTDDEAWVMSASYKLARDGVFGTDMFRDFFGAEDHYFFNMPGHHFVVALAFKLLGAGVFQARLVGIVYGLATICLTYLLARRLYGVAAALLALVLLLFLRLNMGFDTGLPLQELAANIRYDLAPVPFMLGGLLLVLARPSVWRAGCAGALFGMATLMQFYAAFVFLPALVFFAFESVGRRQKLRLAGVLVAAGAVVGLPYGIYIAAHFDDFRGQAGTVDRRDDFGSPSFYVDSLIHEPDRFLRPLGFKEVPKGEDPRLVEPRFLSLKEMAVRRPSAKLAVLVGLPLVLIYSGLGAFRRKDRGDLLLFLSIAGLIGQYALFESLKLYIYWIPLVPLLCIGFAVVCLRLVDGARQVLHAGPVAPRRRYLRLAAGALTALCLLGVFAEGTAARISGIRTASDETRYERLGVLVHESVPPGSRVVGSTSLWWALRDTDYRSYFMFFYVTSENAGRYRNTIPGFLTDSRAQYLVLTRLGREELEKHLAPADRRDFDTYMAAHASLEKRLEGADAKSYGYVEVWRLR